MIKQNKQKKLKKKVKIKTILGPTRPKVAKKSRISP